MSVADTLVVPAACRSVTLPVIVSDGGGGGGGGVIVSTGGRLSLSIGARQALLAMVAMVRSTNGHIRMIGFSLRRK